MSMLLILGILGGAAAYCLVLLARSTFRVEEGHLAVLTSFGAAEFTDDARRQLKTYGPGLHWKRPWQKTIVVGIMEQNLDLSGQEGGRTAMADDGTILRFDSILRYVPIEKELHTFLFGMKNPLEHITWLFTCLLRNEIANFRVEGAPDAPEPGGPRAASTFDFTQAGSYALIRKERKRLNEHLEDFACNKVGNRYGVQFNAVDLTDILPPDELADALNAVIQAQADVEACYCRAEGDCQQRLMASERGVEIARARAEAVETEIRTLGTYLAELAAKQTLALYVDRRRTEVLSESRTVYLKDGVR